MNLGNDGLATMKPAEKYFVFNETGNIMIMWSGQESDNFPASVNELFKKVATFYTKLITDISNETNPHTNKPYSIYNYEAIDNYINASKKFIKVTHEDIKYVSTAFGNNYSCDLINRALGISANASALPFAEAMATNIRNEGLKLMGEAANYQKAVGNIFFVCEYLLGAPIISAIVVYCDPMANKQTFQIGPCLKESSTSTTLSFSKDVYTFTP
ncbi:hypothetical protein [Hanstruepera flava]|uniref:hypothetical protein n=1 Tax=Hanstruepera flava TaxID=2930218 RepID=UPI0020285D82|nr:hypothetical protein [Hanstruepera flava]